MTAYNSNLFYNVLFQCKSCESYSKVTSKMFVQNFQTLLQKVSPLNVPEFLCMTKMEIT